MVISLLVRNVNKAMIKIGDSIEVSLKFFTLWNGSKRDSITNCLPFTPLMSFPATPDRRDGLMPAERSASPTRLHPILRRTDTDTDPDSVSTQDFRLRATKSVSPKSQVRFSIPDPSSLEGHEESVPQSPSKIVFPKDSGEIEEGEEASRDVRIDNHGHFLDMQSRVMLDVPEEIWKFHTTRRDSKNRRHRRTTSEKTAQVQRSAPSHNRTKSLQAMIVDTVTSMSTGSNTNREYLNEGTVSDTSQVSPLNLPRPEIYLSPESPLNSYRLPIPLEISLPPFLSPLNKQKHRRSVVYDGDGYSQYKDGSSSSSEEAISDDSIASANHEYSFNIDQGTNVDETLGIDEHGNVNLKTQQKNLRKQQQRTTTKVIKSNNNANTGKLEPPTNANQAIKTNMHENLKRQQLSPNSQQARKSLQILSTPSKLINIPDLEHDMHPRCSQGTLKFFDKFEQSQTPVEAPNQPQETLSPGKQRDQLDLNFTFPRLIQDPDFEKVDNSPTSKDFENRRSALMERNLSPGDKGHRHRRSRSIHNAEDMFAATSTPPRVPNRSPLRPKSPTSEENIVDQPEVTTLSNSDILAEASSVYEENSLNEKSNDGADTQNKSDIGNKTEESLKIVFERRINNSEVSGEPQPTKPMTLMHSFKEPIIPPEATNSPPISDDFQMKLLSPRRSLSNVGSSSSYNSEFSRRSHTSSATSQPSECYSPMRLPMKKKNMRPLKEQGIIRNDIDQQRSDSLRSIYEKRDGKTVEVFVLDDDDDGEDCQVAKTTKSQGKCSSRNSCRRSKSYEEATKNYARILQMCERTADQAKDILLQLIKENDGCDKSLKRPVPPVSIIATNKARERRFPRPTGGKVMPFY